MRLKNKCILFLFVVVILLSGCQQTQESEEIVTVDETDPGVINEELEQEFEDGLDDALQELEELESI